MFAGFDRVAGRRGEVLRGHTSIRDTRQLDTSTWAQCGHMTQGLPISPGKATPRKHTTSQHGRRVPAPSTPPSPST